MAAKESPVKSPSAQDEHRHVAHLSFEEALAELDAIVKRLEGGQGQLAEAIAAYERGAALRQHCEARLAEAEGRVEQIFARADGSLATRPFATDAA
jgi:exodeoxyribonuclease VII small subunit